MKRTVSSERPFGALSDSISVTKPYLYWSTSMERTRSTVSCTAGIQILLIAAAAKAADWMQFQAASVRLRFVIETYRRAKTSRKRATSAFVEFHPRLARIALRASE